METLSIVFISVIIMMLPTDQVNNGTEEIPPMSMKKPPIYKAYPYLISFDA